MFLTAIHIQSYLISMIRFTIDIMRQQTKEKMKNNFILYSLIVGTSN